MIVCPAGTFLGRSEAPRKNGGEKMVLIAVEVVPAGSNLRRLLACASPWVKYTALVPQRLCLPGRHPWNKEEPEVW